ncbi:MAG: hypothetical protein KDC38_02190, partial [Planctomycetes bacterium]|nr:hypothetical protein [Planctomycetota bacterium]
STAVKLEVSPIAKMPAEKSNSMLGDETKPIQMELEIDRNGRVKGTDRRSLPHAELVLPLIFGAGLHDQEIELGNTYPLGGAGLKFAAFTKGLWLRAESLGDVKARSSDALVAFTVLDQKMEAMPKPSSGSDGEDEAEPNDKASDKSKGTVLGSADYQKTGGMLTRAILRTTSKSKADQESTTTLSIRRQSSSGR